MEQTSGNVLLQDKPIRDSEMAIGYMLQQDYLFPWKTIIDNVLLGPKISKTLGNDSRKLANELLEEVGLPDVAEKYPSSLSGGMRQRVALVRTLINNPKILLLDEPFSALDYQTKLKLEDLVAELLKTYNKTTILVTHDIREAIAMSDKIYIINGNISKNTKILHNDEPQSTVEYQTKSKLEDLGAELLKTYNKATILDTHDIGEAIAMSDKIYLMDANPGTIAKTFEGPIELRNETPF